VSQVSRFYTGPGGLVAAIRSALDAAGLDRATLRPADLAPVDEFHIRGRAATLEIIEALSLTPDSHVLDLGSGLGGPARTLAEVAGCTVTGVDLTPEFCEVATALSKWTRLSDRTRFRVGDATATGLPDAAVDAAMTVHVAMNISDKPALYAEAFRVLRLGGRFVVYDVVRGEGGDVLYPVPWASDSSTSFLATPEDMRELLAAAGFEVISRKLTRRRRALFGSKKCAPGSNETGHHPSPSRLSSAMRLHR
jgi:ubiquinone/menaquinone biosynthesis C-methylase UbiE